MNEGDTVTGRIIKLEQPLGRFAPEPREVGGNDDHEPGGNITSLPVTVPASDRRWDTDGLSYIASSGDPVPATTVVQFAVTVEPMAGRWEIAVTREGWDYPTVLRGGYEPPKTREQAIRTRAQIDLLNAVLAASFGIPA